jgi:hypothetical protein
MLNDGGMQGAIKLNARVTNTHPLDFAPQRFEALEANADTITDTPARREASDPAALFG